MKADLCEPSEWEQTIGWYAASPPIKLPDLLSLVAEATRQLCAAYPEHDCHNPNTSNEVVAASVIRHLSTCLTVSPVNGWKQ